MVRLLALAIVSVAAVVPVRAGDINVYSSGAVEQPLRAMTPRFEKATGDKISATFAIVTALQKRILAGEKPDLVLLPTSMIADIEKTVPMRNEGRDLIARVGIAVIVRDGAPAPDISTAELLRRALLSAKSIAMSEPTTPNGAYVMSMFSKLGIVAEIKERLLHKGAINGGGLLVADGQAEIGLYLNSEMRTVKGITIVGLLPPPLEFYAVVGTAIPASNANPGPATSFVKFLASPEQATVWKEAGFDLGAK